MGPKDSSQNFLNWNHRTVHDKFLLFGVLSRVLQPYPIWWGISSFFVVAQPVGPSAFALQRSFSSPSSHGIPIFLFQSFLPHSCRHTSHIGTAA